MGHFIQIIVHYFNKTYMYSFITEKPFLFVDRSSFDYELLKYYQKHGGMEIIMGHFIQIIVHIIRQKFSLLINGIKSICRGIRNYFSESMEIKNMAVMC